MYQKMQQDNQRGVDIQTNGTLRYAMRQVLAVSMLPGNIPSALIIQNAVPYIRWDKDTITFATSSPLAWIAV